MISQSSGYMWKKILTEDFLVLFGALAEIYAISLIFNLPLTWDFVLFILAISSFQYFYDSIKEAFKVDFSIKKIFNFKAISLLFFILVMIAIMFYLVLKNGTILSLYFLLVLIILGILYPILLKPLTKKIVGFKDFYVPLGWNLFVLFYFVYYSIPISIGIIIFMIFVYLRDLVNASYCDIEDIKEDKSKGLKTLAVVFGKRKIVYFLQILNIGSIVLLLASYSILPKVALFLLIPILITMLLISVAKRLRWKNFVVDIEYIIWLIVILAGKLIL
jgi:4-hydroxybenzoate polyprenyltransferase